MKSDYKHKLGEFGVCHRHLQREYPRDCPWCLYAKEIQRSHTFEHGYKSLLAVLWQIITYPVDSDTSVESPDTAAIKDIAFEAHRNKDHLMNMEWDASEPLLDRIELLEALLANVHDELHDPMSQYWCDKPKDDRGLLEALRDRIDEAMEWED